MQTKLKVDGMSCQHCVAAVTKALEEVGAKKVEIDLDTKAVLVDHEESLSLEQMKEAIEDQGYDVL